MSDRDTDMGVESKQANTSARAPLRRSARKKGLSPWIVNAIVLIVGIIIGYASYPLIAPAPPPATDKTQSSMDELISKVRHFKGNPNATITLLEFSDYQ